MAQLQRSSMKVGLVRNIFVTHLHGDHLYGLPGLVLSVLRSRVPESAVGVTGGGARVGKDEPLDVYGPQGIRAYLRMSLGVAGFHMPGNNLLRIHEMIWPEGFGPKGKKNRSRIAQMYWKTQVRKLQYEGVGKNIEPGEDEHNTFTYNLVTESDGMGGGSVVAAPVLHTVPTFAFAMREKVTAKKFDKGKLAELGIPTHGDARELFQKWMNGEDVEWGGRTISPAEVMLRGRRARKVCIIGDTYDADGARHIADGVDVLVHEATNMASQNMLARIRGHSSTLGATSFAKKVGAKRLILNHTSVGYSKRKLRAMENEARAMFGWNRAFVARDLSVFTVPTCVEDGDAFVFRRFVGFANSLEYRGAESDDNPFEQEMVVETVDGGDVGSMGGQVGSEEENKETERDDRSGERWHGRGDDGVLIAGIGGITAGSGDGAVEQEDDICSGQRISV